MAATLKISCPDKLSEALNEAAQHNDASLQNCLTRLMSWSLRLGRWVEDKSAKDGYRFERDEDAHIEIFSDFGRDFGFIEVYSDERTGIRGGLCCHGYKGEPDESFSVTFNHTDVWQIHT